MSETALLCEDISKSFTTDQPVVCNLNLQVNQGQILALLGPSGCGKTTTLRLMAGFETPDKGRIEIAGQEVARVNGRKSYFLPPEKRRIGMVFQDYAIFPHLSVWENIAFGIRRSPTVKDRVAEMLSFVGLDGLGNRMPADLSGGQQQRVALARALAPEPAILLMDEPFSNLDAALRKQVRYEVRSLLRKSGTTAIFVTHDQEEALFLGDHVAVMNQGHIEQVGPPEVIFHLPRTRFVANFIGQADFIPGKVADSGLITAMGLVPQQVNAPIGSHIDVAIRADDITFKEAEANSGNGRIVSSQFIGMHYIYEIELGDGSRVHTIQPHINRIAEGTRVQARFVADHPLVWFKSENALAI
ncbi:MAG: iron(III) transport system ATP-binding protein [Cellvibrionaceae bacterium]|jgi:iron(III) transport system ATP-binding protein